MAFRGDAVNKIVKADFGPALKADFHALKCMNVEASNRLSFLARRDRLDPQTSRENNSGEMTIRPSSELRFHVETSREMPVLP